MTEPTFTRFAEVADFIKWPGVIVGDDETASAEFVLDAASDFLRGESGNPDRWPDPATAPRQLKSLVIEVAARAWNNPDAQTLRVTGPFTDGFSQSIEAGLYLTDTERGRLGSIAGRTGGLGTIHTVRDYDGEWTGYDRFSGVRVPSTPYPFSALP